MKKIIAIFTLVIVAVSMASCKRGEGNVGDDVSDMASDVVSGVGDMKDKITENVTDRTTESETEKPTESETAMDSAIDSGTDTALGNGTDTALDSGTDTALDSGTESASESGADTTNTTTDGNVDSPDGGTRMRSFFNWR